MKPKVPKLKSYLIYLIALLVVVNVLLFMANPEYSYISIALSVVVLVITFIQEFDRRTLWLRFMESMDEKLLTSSQSSLLNMPVANLVLDEDGKIIWYNSLFKESVEIEGDILGKDVQKLFAGWDWNKLKQDSEPYFTESLHDKFYRVYKTVGDSDEGTIYTLYFYDDTSYRQLEQTHMDETPVLVYVQVDNFDEVLGSAREGRSPFIISEINSVLKDWASGYDAVMHRIDDDEFVLIMSQKHVEGMELKRFTILDDARNIDVGNKSKVTLSIGISRDGDDLRQRDQSSKTALELALGRGGDQAVIRKDGRYEFYGGRSKHVERMSRVRSRVVAQGLATLIRDSRNIYIMGHRYPDIDSLAASIGVYRSVLNLDKDAAIVLNDVTDSIQDVYDLFKNDDLYQFVGSSEVRNKIGEEDLLIVVDTHRPNFVEDPELIELFKNRVVIDHHRRGTEVIENLSLFYLEPYASSTSEMVTEIIQYITERVKIEPAESNALLAGIILDTKNFIFNTGVRTFDAAAFLRRHGADTQQVAEFFKDALDENIIKSAIITNANMISPGIVLSENTVPNVNIKKIISQGADELINIKDIHTSFVLGIDPKGTIFASARSNGESNVQVILEKVGGGGHLETAGAQFENKSFDEVKAILLDAIRQYEEEQQ